MKSFYIDDLILEMLPIPAGSFTMGSPENEPERMHDETQHRVTLTKPFWLGKYPVTQGQYEQLMGMNPSSFRLAGLNAPVENVSWNDAQRFCKKLNERERAAGRLPAGYEYTLPTEAQWEYACRAKTTTPFYTGNDLTTAQANYNGDYPYYETTDLDENGDYPYYKTMKTRFVFSPDSDYDEYYPEYEPVIFRGATTRVGTFPANAWGLCDMHGNVLEWCSDWHGDYPSGDVTDPVGPISGYSRVMRGGSWNYSAKQCRSAYRHNGPPDCGGQVAGFRLALSENISKKNVPPDTKCPVEEKASIKKENNSDLPTEAFENWIKAKKIPIKEEEWIEPSTQRNHLNRIFSENALRIFYAIRTGTEISFLYGSGTNPSTLRRVKPDSIFRCGSKLCSLYVSGLCFVRNESRTFRVDRMIQLANPDADGNDTFDSSYYDAIREEREKRKYLAAKLEASKHEAERQREQQEILLKKRKSEPEWTSKDIKRLRRSPVMKIRFFVGTAVSASCDFTVKLGNTACTCHPSNQRTYPPKLLLQTTLALYDATFASSSSVVPDSEKYKNPFRVDMEICDDPNSIIIRTTIFEKRLHLKLFECRDLFSPENPPKEYILKVEGMVEFWQYAEAALCAIINSLAPNGVEGAHFLWNLGLDNSIIAFANLVRLARIVEGKIEKAEENLPPLTLVQELELIQKILKRYTEEA